MAQSSAEREHLRRIKKIQEEIHLVIDYETDNDNSLTDHEEDLLVNATLILGKLRTRRGLSSGNTLQSSLFS